MRKNKKLLLSILLGATLFGAIGLTACGGDGDNSSLDSSVESSSVDSSEDSSKKSFLELSSYAEDVVLGDELLLVASYSKEKNTTLSWASSDPTVATVSADGIVSTHGNGKATVTATYGSLTASCEITVGFGNLQPRLVMKHLADGEITVLVGEEYALEGAVSFNGKEYPCDLEVTCSGDAVSYSNGKLNAVAIGQAEVSVSTKWKGFDTVLLSDSFSVNVLRNLTLTSFVSYDGESQTAADDVALSIVNEWGGASYVNSAKLSFFAYDNDEKKEIAAENVQIIEGENCFSYDDGVLTALEVGQGVIEASYESEGTTLTKRFTVNTYCPVIEYTQLFEYDVSQDFPVSAIFGKGAKVIGGKQGDVDIRYRSGKFNGIETNGYDTETIEVWTSLGGYRFTNLFVYNCKLTSENFLSKMTLGSKVITGYYVLGEDVTVDMTSQNAGSKTVHFGGIFDGNGHVLNATVNDKGVFGQVGNGTVIKNTHFNFTFVAGSGGYSTGLARNEYWYHMEQAAKDDQILVQLENLYVTSTNYLEKSYALMKEMPYFLTMKDVFVNIDLGTDFAYGGVNTERAALFHMDKALYNNVSASTFRLTSFKNVYLVTGSLIAIADGLSNGTPFVTYAYNDVETIKAQRRSADPNVSNHIKLEPSSEALKDEAQYGKYYAQDKYGAYTVYAYNHIYRYDTIDALVQAGVTKVGTWIVAE